MRVSLKVLQGNSAGKEISLTTEKFLIGRGDDCHLRPKSDAISRRHCVITVRGGEVYVRDLNSRNGTKVNGTAVTTDKCFLKPGDMLSVGPLEFEVVIDHSLGGQKKPPVEDVKEAVVRTVQRATNDMDVDSWLQEADDVATHYEDVETTQFRMEETDRVAIASTPLAPSPAPASPVLATQGEPAKEDKEEEQPKKKQPPGRLPKKAGLSTSNSRDAAAEMLRKFFNNR